MLGGGRRNGPRSAVWCGRHRPPAAEWHSAHRPSRKSNQNSDNIQLTRGLPGTSHPGRSSMAGGRPLSRTQTVSTGLGAAPSSGSRGILSAVNGAAETGRTSHRALALITEASASFLQDALLELDAAAGTHLTVASGEGGRPARSQAPGFDPRGASNSPGRHPAAPVRRVDRHPRPRPRQRQSEEESLRSERLRRSACTRWEQIATKGGVCLFCPLGLADGSRRGTRTPERLRVRKGPAFLLEVRAGGASARRPGARPRGWSRRCSEAAPAVRCQV